MWRLIYLSKTTKRPRAAAAPCLVHCKCCRQDGWHSHHHADHTDCTVGHMAESAVHLRHACPPAPTLSSSSVALGLPSSKQVTWAQGEEQVTKCRSDGPRGSARGWTQLLASSTASWCARAHGAHSLIVCACIAWVQQAGHLGEVGRHGGQARCAPAAQRAQRRQARQGGGVGQAGGRVYVQRLRWSMVAEQHVTSDR